MHDPQTVAFEIKFPWFHWSTLGKTRWRYWEPFITIWHVDPERGGSDDSCGWFTPPLTDLDRKVIDELLRNDASEVFFCSPSIDWVVRNPEYNYPELKPGDVLALTAMAWLLVAKEKAHLTGRDHGGWRRVSRLSNREWWEVTRLALYPPDNIKSALCGTERDSVRRFFTCVLNAYNRFHRPWFRKPRWHIQHWRLQIHPLQAFKRWAFSRCAKCGKGFSWGYSPMSHQWSGTGPLWFKSERDVYHSDCGNSKLGPPGTTETGAAKTA